MKKEAVSFGLSRRNVLCGLGSASVFGFSGTEEASSVAAVPEKKSCEDYGDQVDEFFSEETAKTIMENIIRDVHQQVFAEHLQWRLDAVTVYYGRRVKNVCRGRSIYGNYATEDNSIAISPHIDPIEFADTVIHECLHALGHHGYISCFDFVQVYELMKSGLDQKGEPFEHYLNIEKFIKASYQTSIAAQQEELMVRILADGLFGNILEPMPKPLVDFYSPLLKDSNLLTDMLARKAFSEQLSTDIVQAYRTIRND